MAADHNSKYETDDAKLDTRYQCHAQEAMIYAYHADSHPATRNAQIRLLKVQANMKVKWPSSKFLQTDRFCLQRATMFCLSSYVKDILSAHDEMTRSKTANLLLDQLCSFSRLESPNMPFPTAEMVYSLIGMGSTGSIISLLRQSMWVCWPTDTRAFVTPNIQPAELPHFIETRISIVQDHSLIIRSYTS